MLATGGNTTCVSLSPHVAVFLHNCMVQVTGGSSNQDLGSTARCLHHLLDLRHHRSASATDSQSARKLTGRQHQVRQH